MPKLWREVSWISAAAAALLIALFSSQNGASEQRTAMATSPVTVVTKTAVAPAPYSVESEATRQMTRTVHELTEDVNRVATRLAAVERGIDDLSNTVMRQNQASKEASGDALPAGAKDETAVSTIATDVSAAVAPAVEIRPPQSDPPLITADSQPDAAIAPPLPAFGVEIGSAVSMKALLARWNELHTAHAGILQGLKPAAAVKDNPRTNHVELRLVVGSFASRAGAAKLCASLATFHVACQPVPLDGQQLALQ
jgi:uncharacterized protein YoxC